MHVNEYQSLNQFAMFAPVTKWNGNVAHTAQAAMLTRHAVQIATTGTPGPTHLDIPKDMFGQTSTGRGGAIGNPWPSAVPVPADQAQVDAMIATLRKAERPLLLVGDGVRSAGAWDELAAFATAAGIPVVATMGGKPAIASEHPNFVGIIGRYSSIAANALTAQADCVLALGTRLGGLATNGWLIPSPQATVLQIDRDAGALINPYCPTLGVIADIRLALGDLCTALDGAVVGTDRNWLVHCQATAAQWRATLVAQTRAVDEATPLSPLTVLSALLPYAHDSTLVADTGYMAAWT